MFTLSIAAERLQLLPDQCENWLHGAIEDVPLVWKGSQVATMQEHQWDTDVLPLLPSNTAALYEESGSLHMHKLKLQEAGLWGWTKPITFSWENAEVFQKAGTGPVLYAVLVRHSGWFANGSSGSRLLLGTE